MGNIHGRSYSGAAGIQELTGEIIREFVEKIIVFKAEKVDGHRQQRIQIIYNAIGAVEIPNEKEAA